MFDIEMGMCNDWCKLIDEEKVMVKQNKDILTMLDEMTDEEFLERLESCDDSGLTELFSTTVNINPPKRKNISSLSSFIDGLVESDPSLKGDLVDTRKEVVELLYQGQKVPLTSEYCECKIKSLTTIGLYDQLPSPTSTEDVVRKGYGGCYEIYSPTLVNNELVWKKVSWSY